MVITRHISERLFDFCFKLARERKARARPGRVTCVNKANVLAAFAFFPWISMSGRRHFRRSRRRMPTSTPPRSIWAPAVDHGCACHREHVWRHPFRPRRRPIGGVGMAPSADIGDHHAVLQPCQGIAPDIRPRPGQLNRRAMNPLTPRRMHCQSARRRAFLALSGIATGWHRRPKVWPKSSSSIPMACLRPSSVPASYQECPLAEK